jgi:hypothetical protein
VGAGAEPNEVAEQFKEVQKFLRWERSTPEFKKRLGELVLPGNTRPSRTQAVLGTHQSQTHLLAKPGGLVITKFNLPAKNRSKTNARAAESFYDHQHELTATCNGHSSPTDKSVRSGATVMQRPWPLVKGSGFILVSERLSGNNYLSSTPRALRVGGVELE